MVPAIHNKYTRLETDETVYNRYQKHHNLNLTNVSRFCPLYGRMICATGGSGGIASACVELGRGIEMYEPVPEMYDLCVQNIQCALQSLPDTVLEFANHYKMICDGDTWVDLSDQRQARLIHEYWKHQDLAVTYMTRVSWTREVMNRDAQIRNLKESKAKDTKRNKMKKSVSRSDVSGNEDGEDEDDSKKN